MKPALSLLASLGVSAIVGLSCDAPTAATSSISLLVQSDKRVYSLAADAAAQPLLINQGSAPVYAPLGDYVAVQQLQDGQWGDATLWFTGDGPSISFSIMPGDTLRPWPMGFAYVANAPGVYRFVFCLTSDRLLRHPLPLAQRVSPPFELQP
jgi:hypothetical protein